MVHVLPPVVVAMAPEGCLPPATFDELQRSARAVAQRHLTRLVAKAKRARARVSSRLVEGAPVYDRIVRTAKTVHADMTASRVRGEIVGEVSACVSLIRVRWFRPTTQELEQLGPRTWTPFETGVSVYSIPFWLWKTTSLRRAASWCRAIIGLLPHSWSDALFAS